MDTTRLNQLGSEMKLLSATKNYTLRQKFGDLSSTLDSSLWLMKRDNAALQGQFEEQEIKNGVLLVQVIRHQALMVSQWPSLYIAGK